MTYYGDDRNGLPPWSKPGPYMTALRPIEETAFRNWVTYNDIPFDATDRSGTNSYDMRGFWRDNILNNRRTTASGINPNDGRYHFGDLYKTPYHESFSNESMYAIPQMAPYWVANRMLVGRNGEMVFDESPSLQTWHGALR